MTITRFTMSSVGIQSSALIALLISTSACTKPQAFVSVPEDQADNPSFATEAPPPKTLDQLPDDTKKALMR